MRSRKTEGGNQEIFKKIISDGQTGTDRAAFDSAIKLHIPHGGWLPQGRIAEDGPLPGKCELQEIPTDSYPARTEQKVIDSDGTVIFSHGPLTGGSAYTRKVAMKHQKPWFHIDLNWTAFYQAGIMITLWIFGNEIQGLNVARSRASKDPVI